MSKGRRFDPSSLAQLSCFTCQNRDKTEWCVIKPEDLELLDASKRVSNYRRGDALYEQGDAFQGVFCVEEGTVAVRKYDENGNAVMVQLAHAGQTIGYQDYFMGSGYTARAEALESTTACLVPPLALKRILESNPGLGLQFLKHLSNDLEHAQDQLLQKVLPVRTRLAHLLLALKEQYGSVSTDGSVVISLPMTRLDMASMLGARHETIYRTFADMVSDNVLSLSGQTVMIPDLRRLVMEIDAVSA